MFRVKIFGTSINASAAVLPIIFFVWGIVTWLGLHWHPARGLEQALLIGLASTFLLLFAEFGHPIAHIFSARFGGAPMDEVRIAADMPRTLYKDNNVAPRSHLMRALGGPIFNVTGLFLSIAIFELVPVSSVIREWMAWSAVGHGLLLMMSLTPLPPVDGGAILKWTLVAAGKTETDADKVVRRVDWWLGGLAGTIGVGLILVKVWIIGIILLGAGIVILGVTAGKVG